MNEVLDRVRLIIAVEGSRRISQENMEFLFEKYDLPEEERQQVLEECKKMGVTLFRESAQVTVKPEETKEEAAEDAPSKKTETAQPKKKKGFFSRLFG